MANNLNQCNFIGHLGADPEVRYMPDGTAVANFRIAVGWKGKETEGTEWVPIVAFGRRAEVCSEYLHKGSKVFINGRFRTRKWTDKDGNDRYSSEIVMERMEMLTPRRDDDQPARQQPRHTAQHGAAQQQQSRAYDDFDDDIPF